MITRLPTPITRTRGVSKSALFMYFWGSNDIDNDSRMFMMLLHQPVVHHPIQEKELRRQPRQWEQWPVAVHDTRHGTDKEDRDHEGECTPTLAICSLYHSQEEFQFLSFALLSLTFKEESPSCPPVAQPSYPPP